MRPNTTAYGPGPFSDIQDLFAVRYKYIATWFVSVRILHVLRTFFINMVSAGYDYRFFITALGGKATDKGF